MADDKRAEDHRNKSNIPKIAKNIDQGRRSVIKKLGRVAYAAPVTMALLTSDKALAQTPGQIKLVLDAEPEGAGIVTTPGMGTFWYDIPAVVKLVAVAAAGWRFKEWQSPVVDKYKRKTKTTPLTKDTYITAVFEEKATTTTTTTTTTKAPPRPTTTRQPDESTTTSTTTSVPDTVMAPLPP